MIKAVIFDLDGLLINSEPIWKRVEIDVFSRHGMPVTEKDLMQSVGLRIDEVIMHWAQHFSVEVNRDEIQAEVLSKMKEAIIKEGLANKMPGVDEVCAYLQDQQIPMAVASSSHLALIQTAVEILGLKKYMRVIYSAEFESHGKPHPGVFLAAADYLRVDPLQCLVLEDSVNGMIAAKAARMACVVVPAKDEMDRPEWGLADGVLPSLEGLMELVENLEE